MAQAGYTPISLYYSTTASAVPLAANLVPGELAINTNDGKLYYENSSGVVTLLASTSGASGNVVGPASATDTAVALFDGTTGKLIKNSLVTIGSTGNTVISGTDNSNAMLRITQLGTGNALLVEDSANPDASPVVINASGQVVIGNTAVVNTPNYAGTQAPLSLQVQSAGTYDGLSLQNYVAGSGSANMSFSHSRSGVLGTQTILNDADITGAIVFAGSDGTAFIRNAQIEARVDGTPGTNDMPGRLVFSTTADGASSPTERMRIDNRGAVGIGSTALTSSAFRLGTSITGGTTAYGAFWGSVVQPDVTAQVEYHRTSAATSANGGTPYTIGSLFHYQAGQSTFNADSTVTSQYGFSVAANLTGATNNYGFYGNIPSGTGRWNFYAGGTAANYFAGNTAIGTTTTTAAQLTVAGNSSTAALKVPNIKEVITVSATAATGTINYDITTQSVLYYTSNASANWTVNFRGSSGTSLDTLMSTGESMSVTFLVTQGATAYYNSAVQIDGSSVTPKWQGGSAPTSGNASSIDSYTYVIIKTGAATFTVLATQTKFA
jgi:hypothetical protein